MTRWSSSTSEIALRTVYSIAEVGVAEVFEQFVGLGEVIQSDQSVTAGRVSLLALG